jgi:D-alanyl-D-alanine carboxypeptidase/D-alanyl-D-alanine-endopeptidase (penicillin-binding protein 4)
MTGLTSPANKTPTRLLRSCVLLIVGLLCNASAADLAADLGNTVRKGRPASATLGISIRDLATGHEIYRLDPDRPLIPASNMKVVTTGAALASLGPDFRFRTAMRIVDRPGGTRDLKLVGDGDPAFADPDLLSLVTWTRADGSVQQGLDAAAFLDAWADAVRDAGLQRVEAVVADDRIFDRIAFHPAWPKDQFAETYCAEVHGLNFHHNVLRIWPAPRPGGPAAVARMSPELTFLPLENRSTSNRAANAKHTFWIGRRPDSNALTLNGNVQVAPKDPVPITVRDMPSLLAELLARRLRANGVEVGRSRLADSEDPRGSGRPIGPPVETPLATVLLRCNTDSDNLASECLLKRIVFHETGQPGSWEAGSVVIPQVLARRIREPEALRGLVVSDGSGLSRLNRVTASLMTRWIAALDADAEVGPPFRESLAVGGETGTVRNRFKSLDRLNAKVLCKTGYIRGVSCLSGIVVGPGGRRVAFSVLGNDLTAENAIGRMKELQERVVLEIAEELARPQAALGG